MAATEAALAIVIIFNRRIELGNAQIREEHWLKVILGIVGLPRHKPAQTNLARGANNKIGIGVWLAGRIKKLI